MNTHERLQEIQEGINRVRMMRGQHGADIVTHKAGMMPQGKALFYKEQDSHRMIAVCDRYINHFTRKYHDTLLEIPAYQLAVSVIRRVAEDAIDAKMQAEEFLSAFTQK